jgi:hypothetical protein
MTTTNLTTEQKNLFNTLVRLGDSKELALKTVLEQKEKNTEMYQIAYYS